MHEAYDALLVNQLIEKNKTIHHALHATRNALVILHTTQDYMLLIF